jgi:hypothetical protein
MERKFLQFMIIGILVLLTQFGYSQFQIDAQYNLRFELRDGYKQLVSADAVPAVFISQRSRLSFEYKTDRLTLKFTPQDVRIWGDEEVSNASGVFGDKAALDLFEAYADIKLCDKLGLKVGRQQLIYDKEWLLSARNWNQNGLSYDAAVLKYKSGSWDIHAGGSWNSTGENSSDNLYSSSRIKSLNFLWIKDKINDKINFTLSHYASGVTETDTTNTIHFRQTTGVYGEYVTERFAGKANAFYQFGKNKSGNTVNAFLFDADITFPLGKFTPGLGISYLSGDHNIENKEDRLFDMLYGARHRYFGHMDYYSTFSKNTAMGGVMDPYLNLKFDVSKKLKIVNMTHNFRLAQTNSSTPTDKNLGIENDLEFTYKFNDWGSFSGGYLFYLPTESLKTIQNVPGAEFQQFLYLQLTLTPVLFKKDNE